MWISIGCIFSIFFGFNVLMVQYVYSEGYADGVRGLEGVPGRRYGERGGDSGRLHQP